jgi:GAF domain-containing protein
MVTLHRGKRDRILALTVVTVMYGLGVFAFINKGFTGDGKLYMLTFSVLTGTFFGTSMGIGALALSLLTTLVFETGLIFTLLSIQPLNWMDNLTSNNAWLISFPVLAVLGAMTVLFTAPMIKNLQITLKKRARLYDEMERNTTYLEQQIAVATEDAERRLVQIRTASDIARSISSLQDPKTILQQVVDLIQQQFNLYYVGVFLVDESQNAVLKAGTGQAGQKMIAAGHQLQIGGTSMIGWCIANRQPRIALDVGNERVRFNNPFLPETRSELALPILSKGEALGALTIQSTHPNAFDENDIRVLQGIADSLAIALENSILFEKTQQSLEEIRSLNQAYLKQGWAEAAVFHNDLQFTYENKEVPKHDAGNLIQVPMILRDQVIGQISLETDKASLSPDDLEFVEAVITQTALALENARLIDETQRKAFQEETVSHLSVEFSRGLNIEEIVSNAVKELSQLPAVSEVSIYLSSPEIVQTAGNNGHHLESAA